jgi:hypothetical protein
MQMKVYGTETMTHARGLDHLTRVADGPRWSHQMASDRESAGTRGAKRGPHEGYGSRRRQAIRFWAWVLPLVATLLLSLNPAIAQKTEHVATEGSMRHTPSSTSSLSSSTTLPPSPFSHA